MSKKTKSKTDLGTIILTASKRKTTKQNTLDNLPYFVLDALCENVPHFSISDSEAKAKYKVGFVMNPKGGLQNIICVKQPI